MQLNAPKWTVYVLVPEHDEPKLMDDIAVNGRNADPCTSYDCLWPKYSDGKIYVPYVIANHYCKSTSIMIYVFIQSSKRMKNRTEF